jgi:uncharacterized membrane protein
MTKKVIKKSTFYTIILVFLIILVFGIFIFSNNQVERTPNIADNAAETEVEIYEESSDYVGEKGEKLIFDNGKVEIDVTGFDDGKARFYNTEMPSGTTVYFFVVKDDDEVYRAAANECQICFSARTGFRQEGNEMVCNNCGNRYPIERVATEKGGCNPVPINPNLEVNDYKVFLTLEELEEISPFF